MTSLLKVAPWVVLGVIQVSGLRAQAPAREEVVERVGTAVITKAPGGSVAIARGFGAVSSNSSLSLEWTMVNDSTLGLIFDGPVRASGTYTDPWFRFNVDVRVRALTGVQAFEVRVLTFNVWGEFTGILSFTQLEDLKVGQKKNFGRLWGIYGESVLREHFSSIAYVARVRTADGRTVAADPTPALKAAQRIQSNITLQDLLPKAEPVPLTPAKPT